MDQALPKMALDDFWRDVREVVFDPGDGGDAAGLGGIGGGILLPAWKGGRMRGGERGERE